jgi:glycoside/pentoside/hexuronide:cation symporter, GPH family
VQGAAATSLLGLSLAGLLVFPDLLIADVIDEDETVTGARREGMYFGINGFVIRLAFTMQGITTGLVLTATGYIPSTVEELFPAQPAMAVFGIRALVALVPMLASLVIIFCLARYPLKGRRLAALRSGMASRPAAAEGAL